MNGEFVEDIGRDGVGRPEVIRGFRIDDCSGRILGDLKRIISPNVVLDSLSIEISV